MTLLTVSRIRLAYFIFKAINQNCAALWVMYWFQGKFLTWGWFAEAGKNVLVITNVSLKRKISLNQLQWIAYYLTFCNKSRSSPKSIFKLCQCNYRIESSSLYAFKLFFNIWIFTRFWTQHVLKMNSYAEEMVGTPFILEQCHKCCIFALEI